LSSKIDIAQILEAALMMKKQKRTSLKTLRKIVWKVYQF